jgi:diacylglycerol O-acyltransferase
VSTTRLSALDSTFIFGESQRIPLHVGGLSILEAEPLLDAEGHLDIESLRAKISERLHLVPRFRQRLVHVPFDQGRPVWADDEDFNIDNHVHVTALPRPGSRGQLHALMGRLQSIQMNRTRPLWEMWFIEGVDGGEKVGLIVKIHHAMVDGRSGVELGTLLFDMTREATSIVPEPWDPKPAPGATGLLARAVADRVSDGIRRSKKLADAVRNPSKPLGHLNNFVRALDTMAGETDSLNFNQRVSALRNFQSVSFPLDEVLAAKRAYGVTVNDIVLAGVTGALRRYCSHRGLDPSRIERVKAIVPVDIRDEGDTEMGTKVASLIVDLPVSVHDPLERVERIHIHSQELKAGNQADGTKMWSRVTSLMPVPLLRVGSLLQFRGLMRGTNLLLSNVRGPETPFFCNGAEVKEFVPYFGPQDYVGLNLTAFSYNGRLQIGLVSDPQLMPDLGVFADSLRKSFAELSSLAESIC